MEKVPLTLFLDFDGVLNNDTFLRHQKNHLRPPDHKLFDPENIASLNALCVDLTDLSLINGQTIFRSMYFKKDYR